MRTHRHLIACAMTALLATGALAQSTPATPSTTPGTTGQTTQQPQQGWMMWDDRMGKEYNLSADKLQRLRDVDARYKKDYDALGTTPWTNPDYQALSDRRNADIKGILTPDEYRQWDTKYGSGRMNKQGTPGTKGTAPSSGTTPR